MHYLCHEIIHPLEKVWKLKCVYFDIATLLDYGSAIDCYTEALQLYPKSRDKEEGSCDHERAVCFANRAACHMKKVIFIR